MSTVRANNILDSTGGNTATINGMTPTAQSLQGFRNRIINGDMRIDQRNGGAAINSASGAGNYAVDRFAYNASQSGKVNLQQNAGSVTTPSGFINYLGVTSTSAYSVISTDYFFVEQRVEGYNIADIGWGTANANAVTLSFRVYSSLTGTFGGSLVVGTGSYPFSYAVTVANTWTTITVNIPANTTYTPTSTTNGAGVRVIFGLGAGSTYTATAGSWQSGTFIQPTGTVNVLGTNGATFYITGVQLEAGSVATPFERRPYGAELALCQRYCLVDSSLGTNYTAFGVGPAFSATAASLTRHLPVPMRATPSSITVSSVTGFLVDTGATAQATTGVTLSTSSPTVVRLQANVASGLTAGHCAQLVNDGSGITRTIAYNAEL